MFSKRHRFVLTLFVCGILCCCIVSLNAHVNWFDHFWTNQFLDGTKAEITCNIDKGKTFTLVTYFFSDGSVENSYWSPDTKTPELK